MKGQGSAGLVLGLGLEITSTVASMPAIAFLAAFMAVSSWCTCWSPLRLLGSGEAQASSNLTCLVHLDLEVVFLVAAPVFAGPGDFGSPGGPGDFVPPLGGLGPGSVFRQGVFGTGTSSFPKIDLEEDYTRYLLKRLFSVL